MQLLYVKWLKHGYYLSKKMTKLRANLFIYLFIYLLKNSTQYKQYKIEATIKAVEF